MENLTERAQLLITQGRVDEAKKTLSPLLAENPNDDYVLYLLSEIALAENNIEEAEQLVNKAIQIAPDNSFLYYHKASIEEDKGLYDEALSLLNTAININPYDANYFALYSSILLNRKQFEDALNKANEALNIDPENVFATNVRSSALLKLGRHDESFSTIEGALFDDPNNSFTHSTYGWNLLEKGDHTKALTHFQEALKNNPNNAGARLGMTEALKAKYIIYKFFLKYAFWIGNLTERYQWGVIIGFYLATRVLRTVAKNNESLQPYLTPIILLLALVAFSTWVITPISNLFLRLNKYGKHLLDEKEIKSSNLVGISASVFLLSAILYLITSNDIYIASSFIGFTMMVPLSVVFSEVKKKNLLPIYTVTLLALGIISILKTISTGELINTFSGLYLLGFFAFQWVASYLFIRENNK